MTTELLSLETDNSLSCPSFEGYKLSLEPFAATMRIDLPEKVLELRPSDSQFSSQHLKVYADQNGLMTDPFSAIDALRVFVADQEHHLHMYIYNSQTQSLTASPLSLLLPSSEASPSERFPFSLLFPTKDSAVACDGTNTLAVYRTTEDRRKWDVIYTMDISAEVRGFTLADVRVNEQNQNLELLLHAVVEHRKEPGEKRGTGLFDSFIRWISLKKSPLFAVGRVRTYICPGHIELLSLNDSLDRLIVVGTKKPKLVSDTAGIPDQDSFKDVDMNEIGDPGPFYAWSQTEGAVSVVFYSDSTIDIANVHINTSQHSMQLVVDNIVLIGGTLGGSINPDVTQVNVPSDNNSRLELRFSKLELKKWSCLVEGDTRGTEVDSEEKLKEAGIELEKFSSSTEARGAYGAAESLNPDQLEECDMTMDETTAIYYVNENNGHIATHVDTTSHQCLFASRLSLTGAPSLCLRVDVDGVLFDIGGYKPVHTRTLKALGYVQASKANRKYTTVAPDGSFAVIVDGAAHAFVYHQTASGVNGDLRNRKSGQQVAEINKQQIITVSDSGDDVKRDDRILGVFATIDSVLLLTPDQLVAVKL